MPQVGSVMYAAPEVLTATPATGYDAAHADMWSLGIILFSMLSGTLPFQCAAASRCRRRDTTTHFTPFPQLTHVPIPCP